MLSTTLRHFGVLPAAYWLQKVSRQAPHANSGKHAVNAPCNRCGPPCSHQWRFTFHDVRTVAAQRRGEGTCGTALSRLEEVGPVAKRRELDIAKKYSHLKPLAALDQMEDDGVELLDHPSEEQMKEQRRSRPPGLALHHPPA